MRIQTKLECHDIVKLNIVFIINSLVDLIIVFFVFLLKLLAHETYKGMHMEEAFCHEVGRGQTLSTLVIIVHLAEA